MPAAPTKARVHAAADLHGFALARPAEEAEHDPPARLLLRGGVPASSLRARRPETAKLVHQADDAPDHDFSPRRSFAMTLVRSQPRTIAASER